jgi:tetratricopeptide (TPR) repeat protein
VDLTAILDTGPSPVEQSVRRIRELLNALQYGEALRLGEVLLAEVPENRDALYLVALALRQLVRIPESLAALDRLEQHHPRYSRLYQERGHCYVTLRDAPRAIDAFLRAVNINPALQASWQMLAGLYRMQRDAANADTAAAHVAKLESLPPEVVRATSLFSDGELSPAENLIRSYLLEAGNEIEAMRLLARIGIERGVLDDAEVLLEAVLQLAPDYTAARQDYARVLIERHKYAQARAVIDSLLKVEPRNRDYLALYASACVGLGEHDRAVALYRELLVDSPRAADLHLWLAHSLKTVGRQQEAIEAYHAAAAARPDFGDAYWSLANLKTYRFSAAEIERMRAAESASGTAVVDRNHLCFALGKAFEDRGEFAESWRFYERGNGLKRAQSRYRPQIMETNTAKQIEVCTREFIASRAGLGATGADPIFIVGLPRAGSTLIEQILSSHSRIEGTHELAEIPRMVLELHGREPDQDNPLYPGSLTALTREDWRRLGDKYLADTRIYRGDKAGAPRAEAPAPFFIDKMPNNFRHLGLIHLILPNAKVIDVRREPMACCFGNLKQLFATGQEFTYSIEDIARYYRTYLELMRHWDEVLPGWVLRVWHEDVVTDLESNVRRILDFCGLEFESACLDFHKTERSVRTASSEQVRQPIYRAGLDQWRNYEPWLGPLHEALGDALLRYRE